MKSQVKSKCSKKESISQEVPLTYRLHIFETKNLHCPIEGIEEYGPES